ncbi:MAG: ATP-binding protein [Solirubrobacterales bacterium]
MDAYRNPYTPGAGSRPAALTGRDREIDRFRVVLGRLSHGAPEQGLVIHGLRGVGKTVLLNKLEEVAIEAAWATSFAEVRRGDDFRAVVARTLFNAIRQLDAQRIGRRAIGRLKSAFASFSASVASDGAIKFGFEVAPALGTADSGDLETDLVEIFQELGRAAAEGGSGAAILLDELQLAGRDDLEALVAAIHRANQKALPITVVAAGLPTLPGALTEAKTYAERLFSFPSLGALDESDARDALALPARAQEVAYADDALGLMLERAAGYPYFLQEWGRGVWDVAVANPISVEDVEAAVPEVERKLAQDFFSVRLARTTPAERRYCAAMAALGDGAQESAAISEALGYSSVQAASTLRASLIEKGVVYSVGRGKLDFTVPRFAAFLRESGSATNALSSTS